MTREELLSILNRELPDFIIEVNDDVITFGNSFSVKDPVYPRLQYTSLTFTYHADKGYVNLESCRSNLQYQMKYDKAPEGYVYNHKLRKYKFYDITTFMDFTKHMIRGITKRILEEIKIAESTGQMEKALNEI